MTPEDLATLEALAESTSRGAFEPAKLCFPAQLAYVEDESRFITAVCSRQCGKTTGSAIRLFTRALKYAGTRHVYITVARTDAKEIIWDDLQELNERFALGGVVNQTDLSITLPNRSVILLRGAKDKKDISRLRGRRFKTVVIDEAQNFPPQDLFDLIFKVLRASLMRYKGAVAVIGTPGALAIIEDTFYALTQNQEWTHHHWTILDNPWIEDARAEIDRAMREMGVDESSPVIRREFFGEFVSDTRALVWTYDALKNDFTDDLLPKGTWQYVIGVDLGYEDPDAVVVWGWTEQSPDVFCVYEFREQHLITSELAEVLKPLFEKYKPVKAVIDELGGGKKTAEELRKRHGLYFEPAKSTEKLTCINLFNDGLRTGRARVKKGSKLHGELMRTQWLASARGLKVDDRHFHPDLAMAGAYAYREATAYYFVEPPPPLTKEQERQKRIDDHFAEMAAAEQDAWMDGGMPEPTW